MHTGPGNSVAYIAIENPKSKWPALTAKAVVGSAGPFYLVWLKPELSGILQEEWPYQVVAFEVKGRLKDLYPRIFPSHQEDAKVARGLKLFQQTCFACHTMNQEGRTQAVPDLNLPLNPTQPPGSRGKQCRRLDGAPGGPEAGDSAGEEAEIPSGRDAPRAAGR